MTPKLLASTLALSALALSLSLPARAGQPPLGYVTDGSGQIVTTGTGECWHTSYWTPDEAVAACDPEIVRQRTAAAMPPPPAAAPAPAAPAPATVALAPAAKAPEAQPTVVVVEAPTRERLTLSTDAFFSFGKADLRPTAIEKLTALADEIKGADAESVELTGHTDRLGSPAYNMRLSLQRAEAVKSFLVASGVAPDEIRVVGRGPSDPMTLKNECTGPKSAKLIACLQPDRRVDIEMVGTRQR